MTGGDTPGAAAHVGPEHRWAQATLDRAVARAADPDTRLAHLLAQKITAARAAGPPPAAARDDQDVEAARAGQPPVRDRVVDGSAETEEPARWTTDRW